MSATYDYYDNGLPLSVIYGDGSETWYEYDAANRVTSILHGLDGPQIYELVYTYTDNDLPETITELVNQIPLATTSYSYDNRGRLIGEVRTDDHP